MDEGCGQILCLCDCVYEDAGPWVGSAAQTPICLGAQDCDRGTANCVLFSCPLYSFDRAAVLHVWGRLWNSTFLEVRVLPKRGLGVLVPSSPSRTSPSISSLPKCSTLLTPEGQKHPLCWAPSHLQFWNWGEVRG